MDRIAAALRTLILSGCRATRCPIAAIVTVLEAKPEAMALIAYPYRVPRARTAICPTAPTAISNTVRLQMVRRLMAA
ncbi:hypothetical protein D3C84_1144750 [compost metagenome]